jgi:hypothetical protein
MSEPDMPTDGNASRLRVNFQDAEEVRFWMDALGCTEEQLLEAVAEVGDIAGEVRVYLLKGR